MESTVKPQLESYFQSYFKEKPSQRKESEQIKQLPENLQWFPNNSVQFIPYEPEVERYGGSTAILVAEKQFEISSNAVLAVIEESKQWDYDRALGAAIQLHLGFAFSLGMDLKEAAAFYSRISALWFSRAYIYEKNITPEELKKRRDTTTRAFEDNFSKQKSVLVPYFNTLWKAFTGNVEFEQEWLNQWLTDMAAIRKRLKDMQTRGELVFPSRSNLQPLKDIPESRQQLWGILESYVHMTNNRLGILNRDEAFLGYLIKESLKEVVI
jgi:thiopeptide-type bacteriocin biosynthesis protein